MQCAYYCHLENMSIQIKQEQNTGKAKNVKCWEEFGCTDTKCPAFKSLSLRCWLYSGTHCHDQIQGKFIEKMEICLNCTVFQKNMDPAAMKNTLEVTKHQFNQFRQLVD